MSGIQPPLRVAMDLERRTSLLYFPAGSVAPDGEYYLRGGICWPIAQPGGGIEGFAVLAGEHVKSRVAYAFAERRFQVVDHVPREDGGISYEGIAPWFVRCWAAYFADTFFFHQDEETHRKYLLQVIRSPMIVPEPGFVEAPWGDTGQAIQTLWERIDHGRLKYRRDESVFDELKRFKASPGIQPPPAVWALMCAVAGLDRYPFRGER